MKKTDNRRKFLVGISGAIGGVTGLLAASPFVASLRPSRKAEAAGEPVSANFSALSPGELRTVEWRRKLVWLFGRDKKMLKTAAKDEGELSDPNSEASMQPDYCKNKMRSIKPEIFVAIGLCTHLGCSPRPVQNDDGQFSFFCACHGSRFDVAGRVVKGSPAPKNLIIPPHYYDGNDNIVIGKDSSAV